VSFVERNKIWLLPLLGVGVAGVLWMNYQAFKPKVADPVPAPITPAPLATPPVPAASAPVTPAVPPPSNAGADLWADLRSLEAPAPELTRTDELLREGAKAVDVSRVGQPIPPVLDPRGWQALPDPVFPKPPVAPGTVAPARPLPRLEFVLETARGEQEAWFEGRPYREGENLDGTHRIKQITRWAVVLSGPAGDIRLSTELGRVAPSPKAKPRPVSAEAM